MDAVPPPRSTRSIEGHPLIPLRVVDLGGKFEDSYNVYVTLGPTPIITAHYVRDSSFDIGGRDRFSDTFTLPISPVYLNGSPISTLLHKLNLIMLNIFWNLLKSESWQRLKLRV